MFFNTKIKTPESFVYYHSSWFGDWVCVSVQIPGNSDWWPFLLHLFMNKIISEKNGIVAVYKEEGIFNWAFFFSLTKHRSQK